MALTPTNRTHALQIQAGIQGRKRGHEFEARVANTINNIGYPLQINENRNSHLQVGDPAISLLQYVCTGRGKNEIKKAVAISTGALATLEEGRKWLEINGIRVKKCKSDLIITIEFANEVEEFTLGVSTKQCSAKTPTNAQLFFTTARGFVNLLAENGIAMSDNAVTALRQFCGDKGFRPIDLEENIRQRQIDRRRYFWEEIDANGRLEWERVFSSHQDRITRLLLRKAYRDDPFPPDIVLHKTKFSDAWTNTEVAIYTVDELVWHSHRFRGFFLKEYQVRKGSYIDPPDADPHLAPSFGIIQMQRGGQKQHPEQLQFNLMAGYFYKIPQERSQMISDRLG